jgi:AcrR family transcriptional regulator
VPFRVATAAARHTAPVGGVDSPQPTRDLILDTAERLFAARGAEGVALRDLAREMGLTAPSLYNHFPSKQALYDAVLERGLRPIVEIVGEAWHPGALRPDRVRARIEELIAHLTVHPHLGRLLQRALLDDSGHFHALVERWLSPLYRQGLTVIRETAGGAGWEPEEVPYLAIGLFGVVFSYFINVAALESFAAWTGDPMSPRALALQQRFLEEALYRLLGPPPRKRGGKRAARSLTAARHDRNKYRITRRPA